MFIRTQTNGDRAYLLLVENDRVNGRLVQRVLHRLGRLDQLRASGQLEGLVKSLGRVSEKVLVLDAHARGASVPTQTLTTGPALIFEHLWRECGIADVLRERLGRRRFGFSVERAIFLTVLHRLFAPGSDRAAERWRHDYAIPRPDRLELHQLYGAMRWLGTPLPPAQQAAATPFAPRTTKDLIEEALFARRRDLFSQRHVVFFDTTSLYFYGAGGGHRRPARPGCSRRLLFAPAEHAIAVRPYFSPTSLLLALSSVQSSTVACAAKSSCVRRPTSVSCDSSSS